MGNFSSKNFGFTSFMNEIRAILMSELPHLFSKLLQVCALFGCNHISGDIKLSLVHARNHQFKLLTFLFRDSLDAKQKEQADLKVEMEKMSDLISELRVNCQTLQTELSEVRAVSKDRSDAAVQASLLGENSRPSTRKLSTSSISQESIRKARLVQGDL